MHPILCLIEGDALRAFEPENACAIRPITSLENRGQGGCNQIVPASARTSVLALKARDVQPVAGFRQGKVRGDPWQQGGVLVVLPGGRVVYRYLSSAAGDHPAPAAVVAGGGARPPQPMTYDPFAPGSPQRAAIESVLA